MMAGGEMTAKEVKRFQVDLAAWSGVELAEEMVADPRKANHFREKNDSWRPVFALCDLSGMDLKGLDLSSANFNGTNLANADLRDSNLRSIKFRSTILSQAKMDRADMRGVDLTEAEDLTGATVVNANFYHARLTAAQADTLEISDEQRKDAIII